MGFFSNQVEWENIELGWRFKRNAWGYGYATEAAKAVMQALSEQQEEIKKFSAVALAENVASIGIMKKLGMQFKGIQSIEDPFRNQNVDCVVYTTSLDF